MTELKMSWVGRCGGCGKELRMKDDPPPAACARCKSRWYCGKDCQVKDWQRATNGHKEMCAVLAALTAKNDDKAMHRSMKTVDSTSEDLLSRCNEILEKQTKPGMQLREMIEDVVRKQKSSKKSRHLIMMGARTIEDNQCTLMALDEKEVKAMLKEHPDFARHANLVSSYDPSTELVIAFDVESPPNYIVFRAAMKDLPHGGY